MFSGAKVLHDVEQELQSTATTTRRAHCLGGAVIVRRAAGTFLNRHHQLLAAKHGRPPRAHVSFLLGIERGSCFVPVGALLCLLLVAGAVAAALVATL